MENSFTPPERTMKSQKLIALAVFFLFAPIALLIALLSLITRWITNAIALFDLALLLIIVWMNTVLRDLSGLEGDK